MVRLDVFSRGIFDFKIRGQSLGSSAMKLGFQHERKKEKKKEIRWRRLSP